MKRKDFIIYSLIFVILMGVAANIVTIQLTGDNIADFVKKNSQEKSYSRPSTCSDQPVSSDVYSDDPQLKVINEYEKACKSAFFDQMMLFTNMPVSSNDSIKLADEMTVRIKKFTARKMKPVVIVEPDSIRGLIDFQEYATGYYDEWIRIYFDRLKKNGLTAEQIGTWIPFPEPQQPFWNNNTNPDDFAVSVNRYFKIYKSYFPQAKSAILLDSQVGEEDTSSKLIAYTRLLDNDLIDMAGVQGFPWHPSDENDRRLAVIRANQFIPAYLVQEVAESLNTKEVLINTGTYRHRKTVNGGSRAISTEERQLTLESIVREVEIMQASNYKVTVNIFAENKLDLKEGVDWSYWQANSYGDSTHTALFMNFVRKLEAKNVTISMFDSRK